MADQNDNKPDLVGLAAIHDANEDRAVDSLDWRDVLHDHLKEAAGKSYSFRAPRGEQIPFFALKPSAFAVSAEEAKRVFDEIMAMPEMIVVFEDGEITPEFIASRGGTDLSRVFDHLPPPTHVVTASEDGVKVETAREHNERKYPDLMRRIDALANRPLKDDSDDR